MDNEDSDDFVEKWVGMEQRHDKKQRSLLLVEPRIVLLIAIQMRMTTMMMRMRMITRPSSSSSSHGV